MPASAILTTPVGDLAVVLDDDGTVIASGFAPLAELTQRLGPPAAGSLGTHGALREAEPSLIAPVTDAVERYFAGDVAALAGVPVRQAGGRFATAAWDALRASRPGEQVTYAELARRAGSPGAARAAGQACARNLLAPFVPCHRVVPTGGGVGRYAYGADVKSSLLAHERAASVAEHARGTT